ncbi:MAG: IS607 family transposase [Candidatus Odinarchaeota archaeon]|nr:IS607 family transposase [Candidatus Odinarchaeota archaeon]MDO8044224.1 IS607 family transposase [Candidatus Baldrarchaeota archaeon]RLI00377.1 MAG: IS607 family transposase [Candidatus Bathyarchaeota archaeon]
MERLLTLKEACRLLGVHPNTLRKWDKQGKIRVVRTVGGRRRIPESEVKRLMGIKEIDVSRRAAIYVRVSSHDQKQKGDLERQKQHLLKYARTRNYEVAAILEDVASGLDENRKGLNKLFNMVDRREIGVVIVSFKDRLTRFGFKYLERYFSSHNVKIEVVDVEEPKDVHQELVEDLIAIVSSFAGKLYGLRSHKYKKVVKGVKEIVTN